MICIVPIILIVAGLSPAIALQNALHIILKGACECNAGEQRLFETQF